MHWTKISMVMEFPTKQRLLVTHSQTQQTRTVMAMVSVTDHLHLHCQQTFVLQDRTHSRTMLQHLRIQTVTAPQTNSLKALKPIWLPIQMMMVTIGPMQKKSSVEPTRRMHQALQSTVMVTVLVTQSIQTMTVTLGPMRTKHSVEPTPRAVQAHRLTVMMTEFVTHSIPRYWATPTTAARQRSSKRSSTNPTS